MDSQKINPLQEQRNALIANIMENIYNLDWKDQNDFLFQLLDNFNTMRSAKIDEKAKDAEYHAEQQKIFITTLKG